MGIGWDFWRFVIISNEDTHIIAIELNLQVSSFDLPLYACFVLMITCSSLELVYYNLFKIELDIISFSLIMVFIHSINLLTLTSFS